ncbi:hypothetical protein [Pontibacter ummariensis]|uniref:hypothetical protein n=1 Tax=Pontibacter ummariensis TaxID=1610492 RepID=UPI000B787530|nr:hypothetical protein [Pontibacter ummariensis]
MPLGWVATVLGLISGNEAKYATSGEKRKSPLWWESGFLFALLAIVYLTGTEFLLIHSKSVVSFQKTTDSRGHIFSYKVGVVNIL